MIKRIVEADNEAKAIEEANKKEAEELKIKAEKKAEEIYSKRMSEALETVKKNDVREEAATAKMIEEIQSKQNSALIKLKADFDNNRDFWVDEIVRRVIG